MFQLTNDELEKLRFRIEALENPNSSQSVMTYDNRRPASALPYAFTELGVAMLSGVLNSDKAVSMNIAIMRAFVEVRRVLLHQMDLKEQLKQLKEKLGEHDAQLNQIYDAMENLLDEKAAQENGRTGNESASAHNNSEKPCHSLLSYLRGFHHTVANNQIRGLTPRFNYLLLIKPDPCNQGFCTDGYCLL